VNDSTYSPENSGYPPSPTADTVPSFDQAKAAVEYLLSEDENAQHRTGYKLLSVHGAAMLDLIRRYIEASPDEQFGDAS
jgi:hypothetical protein